MDFIIVLYSSHVKKILIDMNTDIDCAVGNWLQMIQR